MDTAIKNEINDLLPECREEVDANLIGWLEEAATSLECESKSREAYAVLCAIKLLKGV